MTNDTDRSITLDVVTVGRASVDLYGEQIGGRLEDVASFSKYIGGCPANIAVGAARLGLRSALLTRVGDEHMGRFIREQLAAEGVETAGVVVDRERLTALAILGIRDERTFPLIFYRENCADMALSPDDINEKLVGSARAVVVTGTHFSTPGTAAASRRVIEIARARGREVVFDIDYRPVLWGLAPKGLGEERYVADTSVTERLLSIVGDCDLIVGTEEEFHIAGGNTNTIAALRRVREHTNATLLCKRGSRGCSAFVGPIPDSLDQGVVGEGFEVEVYNVLGAGDAFLSGFLRGRLRGEPLETCCRHANACGAFAVSRHGCAPAVPTWRELEHFLRHGSPTPRLREDATLNHLHWATTRTRDYPFLTTFAFDHRVRFQEVADKRGVPPERVSDFKLLAARMVVEMSRTRPNLGVIVDGRFGKRALEEITGSGLWIGRPIEIPMSRPLRFEGASDVATVLREWPTAQVVKCLVHYHPDDGRLLRNEQEQRLITLFEACRRTGHELLLEVIPPRDLVSDATTLARALERLYRIGVRPDWWKLPPPAADRTDWEGVERVIEREDPLCRGVLALGLDAPLDRLGASIRRAAARPICKGFAVGRTIFGEAADAWFAGRVDDDEAVRMMKTAFETLIDVWVDARSGKEER